MAEEQEQAQRKQRHRSPPYPSSTLKEAIDLAKTFYESQRRNSVHFEAAMRTLGYQPKSSGGLRAFASMIGFGLIEDEGASEARKVKLTDLGYRLMVLPENDPDRLPLLQQAARKPTVYADMLNHWSDGLPSDDAISKYLILDKNFNPASVAPLLKDFRATLEFAKIGFDGTLSGGDEDTDENDGSNKGNKSNDQNRRERSRRSQSDGGTVMTSLVIPIREGVEAELSFPADLTQEEFTDMKDYLDTFLSVQERKVARRSATTDEGEKG